MIVQEPVQAAIWHCLNHYAFTDAQFLAERLYSEVQSEESALLLATSYYRSGSCGRAYWLLTGRQLRLPLSRYLLALCCVQLERLSEAEAVLLHSSTAVASTPTQLPPAVPASTTACGSTLGTAGGVATNAALLRKIRTGGGSSALPASTQTPAAAAPFSATQLSHDDIVGEFGESAAFVFRLLARIYTRTERKAKAVDACRRALRANPFLFHSYADLCRSGEKVEAARVFTTGGMEQHLATSGLAVPATVAAAAASGSSHTHHQMSSAAVSDSLCTPVSAIATAASMPSLMVGGRLPAPTAGVNCTSTPVQGGAQVGNCEPGRVKQSLFRSAMSSFSAGDSCSVGVSPMTPSFGCMVMDTPSIMSSAGSSCTASTAAPAGVGSYSYNSSSSMLPLAPLSSPFLPNSINTDPSAEIRPTVPVPRRNMLRKERVLAASAVKENNKQTGHRFVTPCSPSRKIKTRSCRSTTTSSTTVAANNNNNSGAVSAIIGSAAEVLNEKNRADSGESMVIASTTAALSSVTLHQLQHATWHAQKQSVEGLMTLLRDLGTAYQSLCRFDCANVLEVLGTLSPHQYNTVWVLSLAGKAYFELNKYTDAVRMFEMVRRQEPYRMEMMEYYSTALWHLQKEVELSALVQDLLQFGRDSPQAWCAAGNCFSLQKEHDTAIKFFNRAIQLSPNFAYGHTLLGHEHVLTEELDRAMDCFRRAMAIDPRHYNAWYGIGMIFYKQERYKIAEMYFKNALEINPQSSVLLCHVGVVQHNLQRSAEALCTLDRAISRDPANPLCLFHRASINLSCGRLHEALDELHLLKRLVPKESLVYFLIGKAYEKLGEPIQARMHFSWALDLDPKGANNQLKEAVEMASSPHTPSNLPKHDGGISVLGSNSLLSSDVTVATTTAALLTNTVNNISESLSAATTVGGGAERGGGPSTAPDTRFNARGALHFDMDSDDTF